MYSLYESSRPLGDQIPVTPNDRLKRRGLRPAAQPGRWETRNGLQMMDFIFFMHDDVPQGHRRPDGEWTAYFAKLREIGAFQGGSSIGDGVCASKSSPPAAITGHISGYIRVSADSLESARNLVVGNPVYEAGGTVEIREVPRTG